MCIRDRTNTWLSPSSSLWDILMSGNISMLQWDLNLSMLSALSLTIITSFNRISEFSISFWIDFLSLIIFITLTACQTVTDKIDEKTELEKKELSKWLNKTEEDLKNFYGQPDKVEFLKTRNRNYVYFTEKYKIKCERKFEVNPKNIVVGFSSKNCF